MIIIIDFGSQYNQLIARRVRESRVYCQIVPPALTLDEIKALRPEGIILSGGPSSIYAENSPKADPGIFELGVPVLGICYGIAVHDRRPGGHGAGRWKAGIRICRVHQQGGGGTCSKDSRTGTMPCWMSHGDSAEALPPGFGRRSAPLKTRKSRPLPGPKKSFTAFSFTPEVEHTPKGTQILENFLFEICGCKPDWTMTSFAEEAIETIRGQVGGKKVILGLSGGVDSSVTGLLIHKAIGSNLTCIFVDNGLASQERGGKAEGLVRAAP